ncbi:HK97 gp10 family phage protein [Cytobacillus gottheilii]|uniref:HK97 gp10 family phage protein n=1 Tax=Cytobacillus gottheilii TaxID=859144 RepID=A0ABX8F948_9BACI|nr:HK97 gp10 family phage protein [Cytobacillus gottheilii]QVY60935.1 HK97 gp10 family phage protein [Cytobacillus gottheilii]
MASWGTVDFQQLRDLQRQLNKVQASEFDKFCEDVAKELAARLLAKVIKRTPTGKYPASTGKVGGTLKRGWTAKTHAEAASGSSNKNAKVYADSLPVTKTGNVFKILVINPVHYAPYVEFGHRTRNHKGWVPGQFMLSISEDELRSQAQAIVNTRVAEFLRRCFQ